MYIEDYQPEDFAATYFDVADGVHEMKIAGAVEKLSKKGKRMIEVTYAVKECPTVGYVENFVEGEYFNRNITKMFRAFGIQFGNFNFQSWVGKYGKGNFTHRQETFPGNDGIQKTINKCVLASLIVPENQTSPQQPAPQQNYQQYQQPNWQ